MCLVTSHLVGVAEVAELLGVTRQRVNQLIEIYEDFPVPEIVLKSGRVWRTREVEAWQEKHSNRGPGRRRRSASKG